MMNQELIAKVSWKQGDNSKHLQDTIHEMFPISAHKKDVDIKMMTARYLQYKMDYVKHLAFNPEEQNLSKFF